VSRHAELSKAESALSGREAAVAEREAAVAALEAALAERDAVLAARQSELTQRENEQSQRESQLKQREAELTQREAELAERGDELTRRETALAERAAELHQLAAKAAADGATHEGSAQAAAAAALQVQQAEFEAQQAVLQKRIDELTQQLEAAKSQAADVDGWRRKYELALEDGRSLRQRLAEAERRAAQPAPTPTDGRLDWEAQKRRLLQILEDDEDEDLDAEQRVQMKDLIAKTDAALARKQAELDELRALLQAQSSAVGAVAVGAAAVEQVLNKDELILQERERLRLLQAEWQEKLRTAEVELSLERARLAREKAELAEQMRTLEAERAAHQEAVPPQEGKKQPPRGRWLAFLGLKDDPPAESR
jgi:hypothetical protein